MNGDPFVVAGGPSCFFCGGRSTLLCDGILGTLKDPTGPYAARDAKQFTCDRPLCRACVVESGMIHFNMGKNSHWDSRDFCRDCVKEELQHGDRMHKGYQRRLALVTMEEGKALQARRLFSTAQKAG